MSALSDQDQELIERYHQQRLTPSEKTVLEKRFREEPLLKEEATLHGLALDAIKTWQRQQWKSKLQAHEQTLKPGRQSPAARWNRPFLFLIIGMLILISSLVGFYFIPRQPQQESPSANQPAPNSPAKVPVTPPANKAQPTTSPNHTRRQAPIAQQQLTEPEAHQLFAAYFKPYQNALEGQRSRSGAIAKTASDFFAFYNNAAYEQALTALTETPDSLIDNNWRFFQANALLQQQQVQAAIPILTAILQDKESVYQEQAKWYLALAYLYQNDLTHARSYLTTLAQTPEGSYKRTSAQELLSSIE